MKIILSLLFVFFSSHTFSKSGQCHIETYPKIYTVNPSLRSQNISIIKKSDCSLLIQQSFAKFILTSNGKIGSRLITTFFKSVTNHRIILTPKVIAISSLESLLNNKFVTNQKWSFKKISGPGQLSAVGLTRNQTLQTECYSCDFPGRKSIRLIIKDIRSKKAKHYFNLSANLLVRTKAIVPRSQMSVNNLALKASLFKDIDVYVEDPSRVYSKKSNLHFYKLNKPLKLNSPLLYSDLSPVQLVRAGTQTKIILNKNTISLMSSAMAMRSGGFGDIVQLRFSNNKMITGKVIDLNKVVIDL